jgi:hypothetical protein
VDKEIEWNAGRKSEEEKEKRGKREKRKAEGGRRSTGWM